MNYNTQLHILDSKDRQRLADFLLNELGIANVMYMYANGHDVKILCYVE